MSMDDMTCLTCANYQPNSRLYAINTMNTINTMNMACRQTVLHKPPPPPLTTTKMAGERLEVVHRSYKLSPIAPPPPPPPPHLDPVDPGGGGRAGQCLLLLQLGDGLPLSMDVAGQAVEERGPGDPRTPPAPLGGDGGGGGGKAGGAVVDELDDVGRLEQIPQSRGAFLGV